MLRNFFHARGIGDQTLTVDGLQRTFQLHVPSSLPKPAPLLIVLHGGGGASSGMRRMTDFDRVADQHGFIVVYPDGLYRQWNDRRGSGRQMRSDADDVKFISALIDSLAAHLPVDTRRVYATGMSNGGMMTYRLACDLSDKIAAFAVVTANISPDFAHTCKPPRPVRLLIMNGTDDPIMPYRGGAVTPFNRPLGEVLSTVDTVKFWANANGCTDALERQLPDRVPNDGTQIAITEFTSRAGNPPVVLYSVNGGGHTWPKPIGGQYLPPRRIGLVSREIDASEVIWNFVSQAGGTPPKPSV